MRTYHPQPHQAVFEWLQKFGSNSTAHQILNPGISHLLSSHGDAITGYVDYGKVRVSAGVPVCAPERLIEAMEEFEQVAASSRRRVCYFYAEERARSAAIERGRYAAIQIGAQPVWQPAGWHTAFDGHASLRAQRHRARNKGVAVVEWDRERATRNPLLEACVAQWLARRGMTELHFLVEPETLGFLEGRRVFVAEREQQPVGFLLASPVPLRSGWLIEQVIRGNDAPNGSVEMMIDTAVTAMAKDGDQYVTLGLTPLAQRNVCVENPWWIHPLFALARAHGRRFYNFDGLECFKAKFRPHHWEPVYLLSRERNFSFGTLLAVAGAFTGGRLAPAFFGTLIRAVQQELQWLKRT